MGKVNGKITVFFEDPFWVAVFERIENDMNQKFKKIFDAMPVDKRAQVIESLEIYNRACAEIERKKECDCNES